MKKFLLFLVGLIALFILVANLGPMILLGVGIWFLYLIFKKFMQTDSISKKIGWVILGVIVLSITVSNIYSLIGLAAAYVIYLVFTSWKKERVERVDEHTYSSDPFTSFEKQWAELK